MPHFLDRIFLWLKSSSLKLLFFCGIILLGWGTIAPVRTLIWWLKQDAGGISIGQSQLPEQHRDLSTDQTERTNGVRGSGRSPQVNCYIVFFTGVGDFSANQLAPGEDKFLDRLTDQHPSCVAIRDVFPYSAANESLGGHRLLAPLWRSADEADGWLENADIIIKIRNLWRFAISIDNRYGPIFNQGIADAVVKQMHDVSPITNTQRPLKLILIGTSGGAQIALGASQYLDQWLDAQIIVVSVGGDFSGTEGFQAADQIYHLHGRQDWIEDISRIVFPARWPWAVGSAFNRAQRQGRYHVLKSGPHAHTNSRGYFGLKPIEEGADTSYLDLTLETINRLPIWEYSAVPAR